MARKALVLKTLRTPKHANQHRNRCQLCGRPRAYIRDYGLCRLCFRKMALEGEIPGVKKASW